MLLAFIRKLALTNPRSIALLRHAPGVPVVQSSRDSLRQKLISTFRFPRALAVSLTVLLSGLAGYAHAARVTDIYQAEVPVRTQQPTQRDRAFQAALETVLIKATGSRDIVDQPAAKSLVASASRYVQQFGYRDTHPMSLWVQFDGVALQTALTDAGLPVWVDERPALLVWIAMQNQNKRYLIAEDSNVRARKIVQAVAKSRGVPAFLPLLDIEDRAKIGVADVLGGFDEVVKNASSRYAPDAVAIAAITGSAQGGWRAEWRLDYGGRPRTWTFQGNRLAAVLTAGIQAIADALGESLAVVENLRARGAVMLSVEGVDSLDDYARLQTYLDRLSLVQDYRLDSVAPGYARFLLRLSGDPATVGRVIGLGDVLEVAPKVIGSRSPVSTAGRNMPTLRYRLR